MILRQKTKGRDTSPKNKSKKVQDQMQETISQDAETLLNLIERFWLSSRYRAFFATDMFIYDRLKLQPNETKQLLNELEGKGYIKINHVSGKRQIVPGHLTDRNDVSLAD